MFDTLCFAQKRNEDFLQQFKLSLGVRKKKVAITYIRKKKTKAIKTN